MLVILQLLLDAVPLLLMIGAILSQTGVTLEAGQGGSAVMPCLYMFGTIPVFIFAIVLRNRMHAQFERCVWGRWLSTALRLCGALAVAFALLLDAFLLITVIEIGW